MSLDPRTNRHSRLAVGVTTVITGLVPVIPIGKAPQGIGMAGTSPAMTAERAECRLILDVFILRLKAMIDCLRESNKLRRDGDRAR